MKQVKIFGLALAAVFALAAAVSSSASAACSGSALPCFHGPYPIHFTALQLGTGTLITVANRELSCAHGSTLGFISGPKDVLVSSIIYTGCKSTKFGGGQCQSGATKGEIKSLQLLGLLGYINKPAKLVGLLLEQHGSVNHFASFECETLLGAEHLTIKGTVICDLSPVNIITKDYHLLCSQKNGMPEPLSFEGGPKDKLLTEGTGPENFAAEESGVKALFDVLTLSLTLLLA